MVRANNKEGKVSYVRKQLKIYKHNVIKEILRIYTLFSKEIHIKI
jgi:hypothetical protein